MTIPATLAAVLYAALAWSPLATLAAERMDATLPVAVRADWPSDMQLNYPMVRP